MPSTPSATPDTTASIRLKKVIYTIEVLMDADDNPETEVDQLHEIIHTGDWSGEPLRHQETLLVGHDACAAACAAQGTDLGFFFRDDQSA